MFKLLSFELKKIIQSFYFVILSALFIIFLIGLYVFVYVNSVTAEDEMEITVGMIERQELELLAIEEELELMDEGASKRALADEIEGLQSLTDDKKTLLEMFKQKNWSGLMQYEKDLAQPTMDAKIAQNETRTYGWPTLFTLKAYTEKYTWMQEKEIEPLLPVHSFGWYTIYDQAVDGQAENTMLDMLIELNNKYAPSSLHFFSRFSEYTFSVYGMIFLIFLFGNIFTKEGLGSYGSINLLRTQPIYQGYIFVSKLATILFVSSLFIVLTMLFSAIVGAIFDRIGDWHYPVLIYGVERTFVLESMGLFLLKAIGLFLINLLFAFSLLFFYSIISNRLLIAIALTMGTLLIGMQLSAEVVNENYAYFLPFNYLSVHSTLTNEFAATINNFNFNYVNALWSMSISSTILLLASYVIYQLQLKNN